MNIHALDLTCAAMTSVGVVAQLPATTGGESGLLELILRSGATGILGAICYVLIREGRKTNEATEAAHKEAVRMIEQAHKEASEKFAGSVDRLVSGVEKMVTHCSERNAK